jgi:O-antigen ligase
MTKEVKILKSGWLIKLFWIVIFLIFSTAPMDMLLNFYILGFNFRFSHLLIILIDLIFVVFLLLKKEVYVNLPLFFLWVFSLICFVFSFNSFLPLRGIGYAIWLFSLVVFCIAMANFFKEKNLENKKEVLVFIYLISFLPSITFGFLQWLIPSFTFTRTFYLKMQDALVVGSYYPLHRINGFNFEPSYFATYLIPLLPLFWSWIRVNKSNKRIMGILYLLISAVIIFLTTSRMGWIALGIFIILVLLIEVSLLIIDYLSKKQQLVLVSSLTIVLILSFLILLKSPYPKIFYQKLKNYLGISFYDRFENSASALSIFFIHPFKSVSPGGVAPAIAFYKNKFLVQNNIEAKQYEASNVISEILAGGGIIGSVLFFSFWISLIFLFFKKFKKSSDKEKTYLIGLFLGIILQWFLLLMNQNLLRIYVWTNLSIFIVFLSSYDKKEVKSEFEFSRSLQLFSRTISSFLLFMLITSILSLFYIFQPVDLKITKIEIPLLKNLFSGKIEVSLDTFRNPVPLTTWPWEKIDFYATSVDFSNSNIMFKFESNKSFLFDEKEKERLYTWFKTKLSLLQVDIKAWHFATNLISLIKKYNSNNLELTTDNVLSVFNEIIKNENLYVPSLLTKDIRFSPLTKKYTKIKKLSSEERLILNRLLIEDVFADYLINPPRDVTKHNVFDIAFSFYSDKYIVLTNNGREENYPGYVAFNTIIFYTDRGRINLNLNDLKNFFTVENAIVRYGKDKIEIFFTQPKDGKLKLSFRPLSLLLRYIHYRSLAIILVTGVAFAISFLFWIWLKRK